MYNHKSLQNPKRKKLKATKEKRQITRNNTDADTIKFLHL